MKKNLILKIGIFLLAVVTLSSCVSSKKYKEEVAKLNQCTKKTAQLEKENHETNVKLTESESLSSRLKNQLDAANAELDESKLNYQRTAEELKTLQKNYDEMNTTYTSMLSGKSSENQKLAKELQTTREFLNKKETELKEKERLLEEKEKRVNELQSVLDKKDHELNALKEKVMQALLGFEGKGLTVHTKNGKVYVSVDERLLFASGKWEVGSEGRVALAEIGFILQKNPDINVLIEGHTDNVPLKGSGDIKDNWDLSVMRATAIVKILLENKGINPSQITAAGRAEYSPIISNDTKESRAKNRRIEIILTPKLDELFQILGN